MGSATRSRPKCLTPLAGRTLLDWQLDALREAGADEIAVVTGYRAELLRDRFDAVFHNERWAETNMVASLRCAAAWLAAGPLLVSYSDIVYRSGHVRRLAASRAPIAITYDRDWWGLWSLRFDDPLCDAESFAVDADDRIVEIGERVSRAGEIQGQYMGLLRFQPDGWEQVEAELQRLSREQRDRLDMTALLRGLILAGARVAGVPVQGGWCELDSESDLARYEQQIASGKVWSHDWRPGRESDA